MTTVAGLPETAFSRIEIWPLMSDSDCAPNSGTFTLSSRFPATVLLNERGAAKAVVPVLFSTGRSFTVDGLREKLREFFRNEAVQKYALWRHLNNVELITALLACNRQLALVGLQLRILNGVDFAPHYRGPTWPHI